MIKRRQFLLLGSLLGLSPYIKAKEVHTFKKEFKKVAPIITAVQEHMFPEGSKIPSARAMNINTFLFATMTDKSFDKDIRAFVLEGAEELMSREKGQFVEMTVVKKEIALRSYEETNYGSAWLSRIMTLSMEGLFCDPIYGTNKQELAWKALGAYGGFPRPKTKYLGT